MKSRQKLRQGIILFSFFLFPATFYYFSPALPIEATAKGIINGSLIIFMLLFISALFLGRGFCGWVCPAAGCQEALFNVKNKKVTGGYWLKWLIWTPWVSTIVFLAIAADGYTKVDFFYRTTYGLSIGNAQSLIIYYLVLIPLIVIPALVAGKRSFCHHLCWMAPFMILGRKVRNICNWSALHLTIKQERCIECNRCTSQCPMSLPVQEMVKRGQMENKSCILCGTCIDVCKTKTIAFAWRKNKNNTGVVLPKVDLC